MRQVIEVADLLLGASNPREAAKRTLDWLADHLKARSVSLWRYEGQEFMLEMGCVVDQRTIRGASELWSRGADELRQGRPLIDRHAALIPTQVADSYLYLDGVDLQKLDLETAADGGTVAVMALHREGLPLTDDGPSGVHGLQREELVATLRLHEWNLARVARVKGVTRKTIYDWMKRYGIPREHVRRT
jgi:hypothetical protein